MVNAPCPAAARACTGGGLVADRFRAAAAFLFAIAISPARV
jgi:hypothetical protein